MNDNIITKTILTIQKKRDKFINFEAMPKANFYVITRSGSLVEQAPEAFMYFNRCEMFAVDSEEDIVLLTLKYDVLSTYTQEELLHYIEKSYHNRRRELVKRLEGYIKAADEYNTKPISKIPRTSFDPLRGLIMRDSMTDFEADDAGYYLKP